MLQLAKLMIKRDRFQLLGWLIGLITLVTGVAIAYNGLFGTQEELMGMVMTLENPAMIAMLGPLDDETVAALFVQSMLVMTAIAVALMNIFIVTRHTRADEEEGRLELLRSLPIERTTPLKAVYLTVGVVNVVLALAIGISLGIVGLEVGAVGTDLTDFQGALLFGVIIGTTGLVFAAFTALFAQLSANNRSVLSYCFAFLGLTYLLRAIGDLHTDFLARLSPLGIIFRTHAFVTNDWWPIGVLMITAGVIGAFALYLNGVRDLGAGLIAARPGKDHGSWLLKTHFGLTLKLTKGTLIGWGLTAISLGASYGAIFGDIETFVASNDLFQHIFVGLEGAELIAGFMSFILVIMALIATIPVLSLALKLKGEEKKNRLEQLLARPVSRYDILFSYTKIAASFAPVMLFLIAFGLFVTSSAVMADPIGFGTILTAMMVYLPALWVMLGIVIFLIGVCPNWTGLAWVYLGYSFMIIYLAELLDLPRWLRDLTPFGHVAPYPAEDIEWLALISLLIVAIAVTGVGFLSYRKRDIQG
ncbi:MAG: ABC transporter permease [Defluviitaleaceae bacterium]|nr:ABC transporter permease [Defluviitaleaceae bacterium]